MRRIAIDFSAYLLDCWTHCLARKRSSWVGRSRNGENSLVPVRERLLKLELAHGVAHDGREGVL